MLHSADALGKPTKRGGSAAMKEPENLTELTFFARRDVVSQNDCTGLIPGALRSEEEAQAYAELYSLLAQKTQKIE